MTGEPEDHAAQVEDRPASIRAAVSNAMVGLMKQYYGKGPTRARTYLNDTFVFCVLEGVATRSEKTLVAQGMEEAVRDYRLVFQKAVSAVACEAVERATGRKVLAYHSQVVFQPDLAIEFFVLDQPPEFAGEE